MGAVETILLKAGDFGRFREIDFDHFETGHGGACVASSDLNVKEPAMHDARGENQCLYKYRVACGARVTKWRNIF